MICNDQFLDALGAWQRGWMEDGALRLQITSELKAAIDGLGAPLPKRCRPPLCYRKRFLIAHNPQNDTEMSDLLLREGIHDGVASWTSDEGFAKIFKDPYRLGYITAIFEHQPTRDDVVVDIPALWTDPDFGAALEDYTERQGEYAYWLNKWADTQSELILDVPLRRQAIVGFCGPIGDHGHIYALAEAETEQQQDEIDDHLISADLLPGKGFWLDRAAAQRLLKKTRNLFFDRWMAPIVNRAVMRRMAGQPSHDAMAIAMRWLPPVRQDEG